MPPDPRQENRSNRPSSNDNLQRSITPIKGKKGEGTDSVKLKRTQGSNESRLSTGIVKKKGTKPIAIKAQGSKIKSVAFLADGKQIVGVSSNGKIRCWLVEDGSEVGTLMDANDEVSCLAVSQDGRWIVARTGRKIIVWNANSREKVNEFEHGHGGVETLDVSPDGTKFASKSLTTSAVRSVSTGQRLFKLKHGILSVAKFSHDSRFLALACVRVFSKDFLHIYDTENGYLLVDIRLPAHSLAWTSDSKQLFALSYNGKIRCLDVSSGETLSEWSSLLVDAYSWFTHISMSSNDTFISSCSNELLSFWDTATHQQIGSVIRLPYSAKSMAMSAKYDLVISGDQGIILFNLREILPSRYIVSGYLFVQSILLSNRFVYLDNAIQKSIDLHADETTPHERIADLEKSIQQLRTQLVDSQRTGKEKEDFLEKTNKSLREDIGVQKTGQSSSDEKIEDRKKTAQQLHTHINAPYVDTRSKLGPQYADARLKIQEIINETISNMPLELIDTKNGHLLDRTKQAEAFEADPIFNELVSSMATKIDVARIQREVKKFYQYVMLSHRWQLSEPRYKDVKNTKVSELKAANKLKAFCKLVYSLGFQWAWCDTCCVDQDNSAVLQESLVAMFTWYRGSILTIVYLHDVPSKSFSDSEWNKRAWTYQEYVAAETVRFYTKDWKPYLGSECWNHKQSPEIISEMQRLSQVTADEMTVLRPDRDRVREKLFLASKRQATRVEDIAYSLLGIFGVSIPVIYGEGTRAVGRFLEHILKRSGDLTILAWTGTANEYNSCLPLNLTVYESLKPLHIPRMETARLDREVSKLSPSIPDLAELFKELKSFSSPSNSISFDSGRLQLHCISFDISKLVPRRSGPEAETNFRIYDATTTVFGNIEIKTTSELTVEKKHIAVHPWILPLLGQEYSRASAGLDETKKALRLIVRLRQPFGALLLEEVSLTDHKRVAADSLIMVRIPEEVPLLDLVNNIKTIVVQ